MKGYRLPRFEQGNILTKEMLECMEEYEFEFSKALFSEYSNGIIRGCHVHGQAGEVYVDKGIIKYEDDILFVPECKIIPHSGNEWQSIKIVVKEILKEDNFISRELEVILTNELSKLDNEIEIGRVRLQPGATIRSNYTSLSDICTEYDTVNVIESDWSAFKNKSISPAILDLFVREALKCTISNPIDYAFVQSILALNGETLTRNHIEFYIATRLNRAYSPMSNEEIYKELCNLSRQFNSESFGEPVQRSRRRIFVD